MSNTEFTTALDVATLTPIIQQYFVQEAARFGLCAAAIDARYVINWGGFVNYSFTISDGETHYHLKLARNAEQRAELRQWQRLRSLLEVRYRAPQIIDWITLPTVGLAGLLFVGLAGSAPNLEQQPTLRQAVLQVIPQLHQDQELAAQLPPSTPPLTCFDTFRNTYIDRFEGDLADIRSALPPFVTTATLAWMEAETERLERRARASAAFQHPVNAPIHGDLHSNNLLVTPEGAWFILDWDDLQIGDPVLDYTTLLAPPLASWQPARWQNVDLAAVADPALHQRLALYQRAQLLDWVIDVLSDYVDADIAGDHAAPMRATKQAQHLQALKLYQHYYPEAVA